MRIRHDDVRRVTSFGSHLQGPERRFAIGREIHRLRGKRWPYEAISALLGISPGSAKQYHTAYRRGHRG